MKTRILISALAVVSMLGVSSSLADDNAPATSNQNQGSSLLDKISISERTDRTSETHSLRIFEGRAAHATFRTQISTPTDTSQKVEVSSSIDGARTGTRPTEDAVWVGKMVGATVTPDHGAPGKVLTGEARISFAPTSNLVSVLIDKITDMSNNEVHAQRSRIPFKNVPTTSQGQFARSASGGIDYIRGRFFGTDHAEVAFEFRKFGIIGAAGGVREEAKPTAPVPTQPAPTEPTIVPKGTISITESTSASNTHSLRIFEGRAAHAIFRTQISTPTGEHTPREVKVSATTSGPKTGTRPTRSAVWVGKMVGATVAPDHSAPGKVLTGEARVSFAPTSNMVSVLIDKITDMSNNEAHARSSRIPFKNVPTDTAGRFARSAPSGIDYIRGKFFGTDHAEAAFKFRKFGIIGAAGGVREGATPTAPVPTEPTPTETSAALPEIRRAEAAITALIKKEGFDNARSVSESWINPYLIVDEGGDFYSVDKWTCGFGNNANLLACEDGRTGLSIRADLRNIPEEALSNAQLRKVNDIKLTDVRGVGNNSGVRRYGAWMENSGFYLYTDAKILGISERPVTIADAFGAQAKAFPALGATYRGTMVGTPADGQDKNGDVLVGDVELTYGVDNSIRLDFNNIVNVDNNNAKHVVSSMSFAPGFIKTFDGGVFHDGTGPTPRNNRKTVGGRFYGPNAEEVAGYVNYKDIIGAWGAKRQEPAEPSVVSLELARAKAAIEALMEAGDLTTPRGPQFARTNPDGVTIEGTRHNFNNPSCSFGAGADMINCTVSASGISNRLALAADLSEGVPEHLREVGGGTQLIGVRAAGDSDIRRYGAWMDHAGFYFYTDVPMSGDDQLSDFNANIADSFGDASDNRPSGKATYRGAMVGTPWASFDTHGDVLVGHAALGYTAGTGTVTLEFTNIVNLDNNGMPHTTGSVSFADVNLVAGSDGAITSNNSSAGLSAQFYGPNQEEVAGRFNHGGIFGAFGAKRLQE